MVLNELVEFGPDISADPVKACALIGPHIMAEENALRSDRGSCLAQGEMWKYCYPKSLVWSGDGFEGEGSQDTSSVGYYEHNVDNLAIEVVGQSWSSEVISFFLEDWESRAGGTEPPFVYGPLVPRNEGCVQGELRVSGFSSFTVVGVAGKEEEAF